VGQFVPELAKTCLPALARPPAEHEPRLNTSIAAAAPAWIVIAADLGLITPVCNE